MIRKFSITLGIVFVLSLIALMAFAQGKGSSVIRQYGKGSPFQIGDLPPGQLRSALEALPPAAKSRAMEHLHRFSFPHKDIDYLRVDSEGGVYYSDPIGTGDAAVPGPQTESAPAVMSFDPAKTFELHSRPGSPNKVYLNFQGGVISGTAWGGGTTYNALPYDSDGNPAVFSDAERRIISDVWNRVAEDFAPFNIDVTTQKPASFGPTVGQVMITSDVDAQGAAMPSRGYGGVAYVGVWGYSSYTYYSPAFVYYNNLGTTSSHNIAEAASHELGHNLFLSHDGTSTNAYYSGHGTGNVSWAPIMGVGYNQNVTQWSKGEYPDANNTQDDIAIIGSRLSFRPDDHGGSMATASPLEIAPSGEVWASNPEMDPENIYPENKGVIENSADIDFFGFDTAGGPLSLTVTPAWDAFYSSNRRGADLDIQAYLYDSVGNVIAFSDPVADTYANVSANVSAGRYYLAVSGVGNSVTPYSNYASLGQYFINGTVTTSPLKADFTFSTSGLTVYLTDASTDSSGIVNSWTWSFGDGGSSTSQNPSHTYSSGGSYNVTLTVTDNLGRTASTSRMVTVQLPNVLPLADFSFISTYLDVNFTDMSTDSDGSITVWSWDFGDGSSSASRNPTHTYLSGGNYMVTLTVTDNREGSDSIRKAVSVTAPPSPPAAPSNLSATVVISGSKRNKIKTVTLTWQDNSFNEQGFIIQRCKESGKGASRTCIYSDHAHLGPGATTFTETAGTGTFKYRVRGWNQNGSSGYSNEVKI